MKQSKVIHPTQGYVHAKGFIVDGELVQDYTWTDINVIIWSVVVGLVAPNFIFALFF